MLDTRKTKSRENIILMSTVIYTYIFILINIYLKYAFLIVCEYSTYSQYALFCLFAPIFDKKSLLFPCCNFLLVIRIRHRYPDFRECAHIRNFVTMISPGTINFVLETSLGFEAQLGGQWPVNLLARPWQSGKLK